MGKWLEAIRSKSGNTPIGSLPKLTKPQSEEVLSVLAVGEMGYLEKDDGSQASLSKPAEGIESAEKQEHQPVVDGFSGPDAAFYWKALEAHQRGWDRLYYRGETYPIEQQFARLSRSTEGK